MQAGLLTTMITLQTQRKEASPYGGETATWVDDFTTRAREIHESGSRGVNTYEDFPVAVVRFELHYYHKVDFTHRVKRGNDIYNIVDIEDNKRRKCLILKTVRAND